MIPLSNTMLFYYKVLKESVNRYFEKDMLTYAAALSYYMIFSLPSILIVILWSSAQFYSESAVHLAILKRISSRVGEKEAQYVIDTLEKLHIHEVSWWGSLAGLVLLLFVATSLFNAIRLALNQLIHTKPAVATVWLHIRIRLVALALLAVLSLFLLGSIFLNAMIRETGTYLTLHIGDLASYVVAFNGFLLDLISTTVLFSLYFRYLPDVTLKWKEIWLGALLTAALFLVGKNLLNFFISRNEVTDLYAAAGSILIMLLWVYYAMAIILFGASFTFTRAKMLKSAASKPELN